MSELFEVIDVSGGFNYKNAKNDFRQENVS